jgi:hypothetical protein
MPFFTNKCLAKNHETLETFQHFFTPLRVLKVKLYVYVFGLDLCLVLESPTSDI